MLMMVAQDYTLPRLDVARALALAEALSTAAPAAPAPLVAKMLARMQQAAVSLGDQWKQGRGERADNRPADNRLDNAWGALEGRLAAYARLPAGPYPEVERAAALHAVLFPDGLSFVLLPFDKEWAESQKRLDQVDEQGLGAELAELVGAPFVDEVQAAHEAYGEALGITTPADAPVAPGLLAPLRDLAAAMRAYTEKLIGTLDEDDAAAVEVVRAALAPIEVARERARRAGRTPGGDEPGEPAGDPTPPDTCEP